MAFIDKLRRLRYLGRCATGRDVFTRAVHSVELETLGSQGADWTFVPTLMCPNSVVFSVGIGFDISFDLALIARYGCQVSAFDPTPRSLQWLRGQDLPPRFRWHAVGLGSERGSFQFLEPTDPDHVSYRLLDSQHDRQNSRAVECPVETLDLLASRAEATKIDLLKLDIEGAEYPVIRGLPDSNIDVDQILVEFHHRLDGFSTSQTRSAISTLRQIGYDVVSVSPNGQEYTFLKRELVDRCKVSCQPEF